MRRGSALAGRGGSSNREAHQPRPESRIHSPGHLYTASVFEGFNESLTVKKTFPTCA